MAGPLFRELAQDVSDSAGSCVLFTGHPDTLKSPPARCLCIRKAPRYVRRTYLSRVLSWATYFFYVLFRCWCLGAGPVLFLVSNPPFLGLIGYFLKRLRGQSYVVLVYDIHPDVLISFGRLRASGLIARTWRGVNRLIWENAAIVFTLSNGMAARLQEHFNPGRTKAARVVVIPNWADTRWIHPITKTKNEFAVNHGQADKLTVLYAGNLGQTHDIETIVIAAKQLKENDTVRFMIVGDGTKKNWVLKEKNRLALDNLTVLGHQPEHLLPALLATGDVAVVTVDKGAQDVMVPSKTYYAMAAGSALIGVCEGSSEVARIINLYKCGLTVAPGDVDAMVKAVLDLLNDPVKLKQYQQRSRDAAEKYYSRRNSVRYLEILSDTGLINYPNREQGKPGSMLR